MAKNKAGKATVEATGVSLEGEELISCLAVAVMTAEPDQLRAELHMEHDKVDFHYFRMGAMLDRVQSGKLWKGWGFETFNSFVEQELGFKPRKALYLIQIFNDLLEAGVPWEVVKDVSWPRLKEISGVITKENAAEWVERAKTLTILQLQEVVAAHKTGTLTKSGTEPEASKTTSVSFKVHVDQKETIHQAVAKAKQEAGTEFDGVALEAICLNYLSGGKTKPQGLKATMKKAGYVDVLEAFEALWPEIDLTVNVPEPVSQPAVSVVADTDI